MPWVLNKVPYCHIYLFGKEIECSVKSENDDYLKKYEKGKFERNDQGKERCG